MPRHTTTLLATALVASTAFALPSVDTAIVKCAEGDVTPDGRVFPEPILTEAFLRFVDLECGLEYLAEQHPDRIEITDLGAGASGLPTYDVLVTDETVSGDDKQHLLVMSSIHGNEHAGREGAARVIEDVVDPSQMSEDWVEELLDRFVIHFVFPNPDGWANGDVHGTEGAGVNFTRANDGGRDLNRNFPVQGFLRAANGTLDQPEGRHLDALLQRHAVTGVDSDDPDYRGWYLGTDNHGQGAKPVAASGLQIVGQFDYEKSERLAHFADGIEPAMAEYGVLDAIEALNQATGGAVRPYEWGTLYDILGYSASGSGIDYYNTPGVVNGTGFATEMTASNLPFSNTATHPGLVNQMWVNSVRAINYTMFRDALAPIEVTFPVGGRVAYVHDPARVRHDDADGFGPGNADVPSSFTGDDPEVNPDFAFAPYDVSRMTFFEDLNRYAERPLDAVRVPDVLDGTVALDAYDSLVLTDDPMPEGDDRAAWVAALDGFVRGGGNLVVTDAAAPILADLFDDIAASDVTSVSEDVGFVDFGDRSHPLNAGLRGVASQTYDVIPIGFPDNAGAAPNWRVSSAAWEANGGHTAGTNGSGQTIYGEKPLGDGTVRFLGALLPQPTEAYFHPYGLQDYAVTYTGYTLLENVLAHTRG